MAILAHTEARRRHRGSRHGRSKIASAAAAAVAAVVSAAVAQAGPNDFSLIVLPDTQHYSELDPATFHAQTQWVVDNAAGMNIEFVAHVGDVVQNPSNNTEWANGVAAMNRLNGVVPYGVTSGNHDLTGADGTGLGTNPAQFVSHFGPSRYAGQSWAEPWYGGASASGASSFQTFTGGGQEFLVLNLHVGAPAAELTWAQGILDANPNVPTILNNHDYLNVSGRSTGSSVPGGRSGEYLWQNFVEQNNEIFMVLGGHYHGQHHQISLNSAGHEVVEILQDYQSLDNSDGDSHGLGFLRIMTFDPDANQVGVRTYSPTLGRDLEPGDGMSGVGNFSFSLDLDGRFDVDPVTGFVWNAGTTGNWATGGNWVGGAAPSGPVELTFGGATSYTATNDLAGGTASIHQLNLTNSAGTVTLAGSALTFAGDSAARIDKTGAGDVTISAPMTLADNTIADITGNLTVSTNIVNNGTFVKDGDGTMILTGTTGTSGRFTGAGAIQVNEGTLRLAANDAIGSLSVVSVGELGTLDDSYGDGESLGLLTGDGTFVGHHNSIITLGGGNESGAFAGHITAGDDGVIGSAANARELEFRKNGSGTWTLTSTTSDFRGQFLVNAGILSVDNVANRGTASALGIGRSGTSTTNEVSIGAATFQYTGFTASMDRRLAVTSSTSAIDVTDSGTTLSIAGTGGILTGTGSLTKLGAGTLVLAGTANYTGVTHVNEGTLNVGANALATSAIDVATGAHLLLSNPAISRAILVTLADGASAARAVAGGGAYDDISVTSALAGGMLGTEATLLDGTNGSGATAMVEMGFRVRTAGESATGVGKLYSDVLELSGVTAGDVYVLSLSYDPAELGAKPESEMRLAWLDGSVWRNAIAGNTGGTDAFTLGAFADAGAIGLADDLGRWGVDTATNTAWAVLNHNSTFVVIPEPTAMAMLAMSACALMHRRRRR